MEVFECIIFILAVVKIDKGNYQYYKRPKPKKLFRINSKNVCLNMEYVMLFSVSDISKAIYNFIKRNPNKEVSIIYCGKTRTFNSNETFKQIKLGVLDYQTEFLCEHKIDLKRCGVKYKLLYFWLIYSISDSYRRRFETNIFKMDEFTSKDKGKLIDMFWES